MVEYSHGYQDKKLSNPSCICHSPLEPVPLRIVTKLFSKMGDSSRYPAVDETRA